MRRKVHTHGCTVFVRTFRDPTHPLAPNPDCHDQTLKPNPDLDLDPDPDPNPLRTSTLKPDQEHAHTHLHCQKFHPIFSFFHPVCPVVEDVDYGAITGIHIGETLSTQIPLIQEKGCGNATEWKKHHQTAFLTPTFQPKRPLANATIQNY